jgi:hypothetical protein
VIDTDKPKTVVMEEKSATTLHQGGKASPPTLLEPATSKSLVVEPNKSASNSTGGGESPKSKAKLQEIILNQKLKHEKRIRALEKLIKLEKAKAHKLQRIMQLNQNDSTSSLVYESFLQKNNYFRDENENLMDTVDNLSESMLLNEDNNYDGLSFDHSNNSRTSNLLDVDSDRFKSSKDKLDEKRLIINDETCKKATTTDNESDSQSPANVPSKLNSKLNSFELFTTQQEYFNQNGAMNESQKFSSNKSSWFFPIDRDLTQLRRSRESLELRRNFPINGGHELINDQEFTAAAATLKRGGTELNIKEEFQTEQDKYLEYDRHHRHMTLQEAFRIYKYNVILNSRKRVREIKSKETKRQVENELKIADYNKMLELKRLHGFGGSNRYAGAYRDDLEKRKYDYFSTWSAKNRNMSQKEIKDQTKKKYEKLPEVQQKKLKEKLDENRLKNRIKSNLYKKVTTQQPKDNRQL